MLQRSTTQRFMKISTVSLSRELVFLCLCFGLRPAPRIFTKLLKVPTSVLRRLVIKIIIYLDTLLILGNSMSQVFYGKRLYDLPITTSKLCNKYKEVLALTVNSQTMNLSLPVEKIGKIKNQWLMLCKASEVSLLDLTKLIGRLSSTIQAVLPARLQFCFLQQHETVSLKQTQSYFTFVKLTPMAKNELLW